MRLLLTSVLVLVLGACRDTPSAPAIACNGLGMIPAEYSFDTGMGFIILPNRYTEPRRLADTVNAAIHLGRNGDCVTVRDSLANRGYDFP